MSSAFSALVGKAKKKGLKIGEGVNIMVKSFKISWV